MTNKWSKPTRKVNTNQSSSSTVVVFNEISFSEKFLSIFKKFLHRQSFNYTLSFSFILFIYLFIFMVNWKAQTRHLGYCVLVRYVWDTGHTLDMDA